MYDLHPHSLLSDGALLPSEVARRYESKGYEAIAITDHADYSNIDFIIASILKFTRAWPKVGHIKVFPGVELTHLPLKQFKPLVRLARKKGIKVIVGHGETLAEPVLKGTNRAAIEAGVDILAHPGLISDEDIKLAARKDIFLEVTARKSHKDANAYVVEKVLKARAKLILNTDSHSPENIISRDDIVKNAMQAGLRPNQITHIYQEVDRFIRDLT